MEMEMEMAQLGSTTVQTCWNQSGVRMAAALSDGCLQLWESSIHPHLTLTAHWQAGVGGCSPRVVWAPAEYGEVIASCNADGGVSVWEEMVADGETEKAWRLVASLGSAHSSILDMQFGNSPSGMKLLVVSADGLARIYQTVDALNLKQWQLQAELQNSRSLMENSNKYLFLGAAVCWRRSAISTNQPPAFVFGCNSTSTSLNVAKVWGFEQSLQRWFCVAELRETDEEDKPVNHVSWAPNIGRPYEVIAVASGDGISIWQVNLMATLQKKYSVQRITRLKGFEKEVWQVEWDMSGMTLASSGSDNIVRLWQANLNGEWQQSAQISSG